MQETNYDRVVVKTDPYFCQLIIPTKKDWMVIFMSGLGFVFLAFISFIAGQPLHEKSLYVIASIILLIDARVFLWNIIGKEVITIEDGLLTIDRFWILFFTPKSYELKSIKNLRADFDDDSYEQNRWVTRFGMSAGRLSMQVKLGGTFLFDYNGLTIKFGDSVDKDNADLILQQLKETKIISSSNLT